MRLAFGDCLFDLEKRELLRGGRPVHLTPKAFQLLQVLLECRPTVLAKSDLLSRLWPGTFVAEGSLANLVYELRTSLGDDARPARYVRTVHGCGYSFVGRVNDAVALDLPVELPPAYRLITPEREIALVPGENMIGRARDCRVRLLSTTISRYHARLHVGDDAVTLEDLRSKNGTFVDGGQVKERVSLLDGSEVRVGNVKLLFRVSGPETSTESYKLRLRP
jgi:DNA-binding winged helix-turn-helix (wHTH) protein